MDRAESVREPHEGNPCAQFGAGRYSWAGSLVRPANATATVMPFLTERP
jgi:hypothetical protein